MTDTDIWDRFGAVYGQCRRDRHVPSYWIIGHEMLTRAIRAQLPTGDYLAQPATSLHGRPTIYGLPWQVDHANPERLDLVPEDAQSSRFNRMRIKDLGDYPGEPELEYQEPPR